IFGEAPDLSLPLPQAPSSRSTPRRNKAICLSSGKRKARLYPPALCLADNDSDTFSSSPSTTPMETRVTDSTSPRQHRTAYRTASSSSSSSSSLFPYQLSTSSSLTSLHISEDYKSCHGSVQSLMSLDPRDATHTRKTSHVRCGSDLTAKHSVASSSNCYQRPGSLLSVGLPQRESSVFSSALDICSSGREAKALYSCEAEHSHELSFPQGALFSNVYPSVEPGWLQATYNGRTGLIPENYITYI
ncbi:rho GTPase-activating protein 42-like protein, partial [Lates japonicus]